MNNTLRTTLIVIAVLVLAGGIFFAGSMVARFSAFGVGGMMGGKSYDNSYGPGMRSGRGGNNNYGTGMMGGYGNNTNATPLSVDQAKAAAEKYLENLKNSDLKIAEVMVFNNNAYVVVKETSTGNGAFELLVDPASKNAYPEFGPNMMWNLKYSGLNHSQMMGGRNGMMGGWSSTNATPANVSADMPVSQDQAIKAAQAFLDQNISGATAAADPIKFYGYYTLDFEKDGKVVGMLSVNGYSGQVFLHTWHGTFIEESAIR